MTILSDAAYAPLFHKNRHLAGGADAFPWGSGGGLDVDLLDGKHASEIGFTDPYYVLTKAYASLVNAKIHPNTGSPNYDVKHEFTDIAGIITDVQHGSRGSGLHADSHARLHDHSLAGDGSPIAVAGVPNLPASKITSERFGMPRMPDGTDGYVLTAKGAGVDPVYEAPAGAAHNILSATHLDTLVDAVVRGDLIIGNATPKWARLPIGVATRVLKSDGVDPSWGQVVHSELTGVTADQHHAQLHRASHISGGGDAFLSTDLLEAIIKRIQESSGPTNLTVGAIADGQYLKRSGSSIVGNAGTHNLLSATHPDTLPASPTWGDILFANSDGKWARKPLGTGGQYLMVGVGEPVWSLAPVERLRATADQSTTLTTFVNSTYLVFDAPANARILFMFYVIFQTAAVTTGIKLSVNCPANYVICCYNTRIPTSTSAWTFGMQRAPNTGVATTGIDLANTNTLAIVEGVLITGATAGTLCLSFASEVAGSSVTIKAGSIGLISRVI